MNVFTVIPGKGTEFDTTELSDDPSTQILRTGIPATQEEIDAYEAKKKETP